MKGRALLILAGLCLLSFATGAYVIGCYPVIYWWDAYMRLAYIDRVFIGPWLPLLQALLVGLDRAGAPAAAVRPAMALIAAAAVAAMAACVALWQGRRVGLVAAALLAASRLHIALATVPYQEPLLLLWLLSGLAFRQRPPTSGNRLAAALCLGLACLTRYEAWLFVLILPLDGLIESRRRGDLGRAWPALAADALLLAAVPLLWLLFGPELAGPVETRFLSDPPAVVDAARFFGLRLIQTARWPILMPAAAGVVLALRQRPLRPFTRWALAFLVLDAAFVVLFDPFTDRNVRMAFLASVFLLPFAALALDRLATWTAERLALRLGQPAGRLSAALLAILTVSLMLYTAGYGLRAVRQASSERPFQTAYAVGQWLHENTEPGDSSPTIAVLDAHPGYPFLMAVNAGAPLAQVKQLAPGAPLPDERPLWVVSLDGDETAAPPGLPPPEEVEEALVWVLE